MQDQLKSLGSRGFASLRSAVMPWTCQTCGKQLIPGNKSACPMCNAPRGEAPAPAVAGASAAAALPVASPSAPVAAASVPVAAPSVPFVGAAQGLPQLLPTNHASDAVPGLRYAIQGEMVPVLSIQLDGTISVFFEHHIVLWKSPDTHIGVRMLRGALKRKIAGMPVILAEAKGPGEIAFSRDGVGHIFPMHLEPGRPINVREHQFLAVTGNVDYGFTRQKGVLNVLFGDTGFFVDRFEAKQTPGVLWLHGFGNVFEKTLAPGEQIDIEPDGWVYYDAGMKMSPKVYGLRTAVLGGSDQHVFNRFTGPGRVGIQSMYLHTPTSE